MGDFDEVTPAARSMNLSLREKRTREALGVRFQEDVQPGDVVLDPWEKRHGVDLLTGLWRITPVRVAHGRGA